MTRNWNLRAIVYLVIAAVGLVGTWTYNLQSAAEMRNYLGDWFNSGPSVLSLTTDILVVAVAASIFMIVEGRRLKMRWLVVYIILIPFVALAFSFPLFLAMRERRLVALALKDRQEIQ